MQSTPANHIRSVFMQKTAVILLFLWIAFTLPIHADIYLYVDSDGVIHPDATRKQSYPNKYDSYIRAASEKYGIAFALIKAIIQTESAFHPRSVSPKGALGLMQLMPENLKRLKIKDAFDPAENITGGTRHFKWLSDHFGGDLSLALAAYNAGIKPVERCHCIPPFSETRDYVKKVLNHYEVLRQTEN